MNMVDVMFVLDQAIDVLCIIRILDSEKLRKLHPDRNIIYTLVLSVFTPQRLLGLHRNTQRSDFWGRLDNILGLYTYLCST